MQTFEQMVTGKFFVNAESETADGVETWPIWEVLGLCAPTPNRPVRGNGDDHWGSDLIILRALGDARIDLRTAHDFRSDGYLFETMEAAAAYAQRRAREAAVEEAAEEGDE